MRINSVNTKNDYQNKAQKRPSFKADIFFVDRRAFRLKRKDLTTLFQKPFKVGSMWKDYTIDQAAVKKFSAMTYNAWDCTVGIIFNPQTGLVNMYHLNPLGKTLDDIKEVKDIIFEQAKELKGDSKTPLQGIILGAESIHKPDPILKSVTLFSEMKYTFDKIRKNLGMDFSIIAGRLHDHEGINVISCPNESSYYIATHLSNPHSVKSVGRSYEIKEIAPKDRVFFNGQDCTKEFAQTDALEI